MIESFTIPDDAVIPDGWERIPTWQELGADGDGCRWPMGSNGRVGWTHELDEDTRARDGSMQCWGFTFGAEGTPYTVDVGGTWWLSFVPPDHVAALAAHEYMMAGHSELEARRFVHHLQQLGDTDAT